MLYLQLILAKIFVEKILYSKRLSSSHIKTLLDTEKTDKQKDA